MVSQSAPDQTDYRHTSGDHLKDLQAPLLSPDSPDLLAHFHKSCFWDERITMAIESNPESYQVTPAFRLHRGQTSCCILEHLGRPSSFKQDLDSLIQELFTNETSTIKKLEILWGPVFAMRYDQTVLESFRFEKQPQQMSDIVRRLDLQTPPTPDTKTLPTGFRIERLTPEHFEQRIEIETKLFGYPTTGTYIHRLRAALSYMIQAKADLHYLVFAPDNNAVGYMTLRIGRGVCVVQGAGVLEEYRRMGITRCLLNRALVDAWEGGFRVVGCVAWDEIATKSWEAMGFMPVEVVSQWELKRKN
ncbi:hypothetical protein HDV05_002139 [Chytridiales sp. JEL 0842]|nr:hypothetical protein HDV05_002139 [Chytridiales sp. JEL 0842]